MRTINMLIEKANAYDLPPSLAFIKFKKVFESMENWALNEGLNKARIDHQHTKIVKKIYRSSRN